jgi:starch phosphorylase
MTENKNQEIVAYISMEIAIDNDIKNYAGGLGVLAGDILKSAADLNVPMVGVTLLNKKGYFRQEIYGGKQIVGAGSMINFAKLKKLPQKVKVKIEKREIFVGVWKYSPKAKNKKIVPVYFLDTDLPENKKEDRKITDELYRGDKFLRLKQEIILGRAGIKMLSVLGYNNIKKIHLNEGHGALAAVELFLNQVDGRNNCRIKKTKQKCVFTTHTSIPRPEDTFSPAELLKYQSDFPAQLPGLIKDNKINFTRTALYFSGYSNTVSKAHRPVVVKNFPEYRIKAITNGVHLPTWTAGEFIKLYDKYIPGWRNNNGLLKRAVKISFQDIQRAHKITKQKLISYIKTYTGEELAENVLTIGFARRFAAYKRPEFLFQDLKKLLEVQKKFGKIQIIFAGKAHPQDIRGQKLIEKIFQYKKRLAGKIKIVFLEDYDLEKAALLVSGVDIWLNNPLPPNEASGTSGMKAAVNGIPQLSTFDGWWVEGYKRRKTGWKIKEKKNGRNNLYNLLINDILPLYYNRPERWAKLMRTTIAINAAFLNTDRVLKQYVKESYGLAGKCSK